MPPSSESIGVPISNAAVKIHIASLSSAYCADNSGASSTMGRPVVSQCAAILPDTSAGSGHGDSAICSSVPSAWSAANRRDSESSEASSAATHKTPGPIAARRLRSGVVASGNNVTTIT